ncbi:MAG: hypothetical protein E7077_10950 [Bacteroidales bacterium]|jgi:hypothetical protein|nr:hypothetical protein [Bacteroidales bacterium]MBO4736325.1 hypothetical protein [Paludibacteraceae bacterium]MBR5208928.1 hypothetical protein [Paludibacteraceae bacterium]MEE1084916.1 hypothetical protein [Paludibacteraceae bacterium]
MEKFMTAQEIWDTFVRLSHTQESYARLCDSIINSGEKDAVLEELAANNIKDQNALLKFFEE